jgi:hypothetical protein
MIGHVRCAVSAAIALFFAIGCEDPGPAAGRDAGAREGDGGPRFSPVPIPGVADPEPNFFGVWGSSASDVFLVGERGSVAHFDGTAWSLQSTPTTADLRDVWGRGPTDVYAAGNSGTVLHYNGTVWAAEASTTTEDLHAIAGYADRVFVAGANGVVASKDLTRPTARWLLEDSGTLETFFDLWFDPSGGGVAVGTLGAIFTRDADGWSRNRSERLTVPLAGVWGTAPDQLWIVGLDGTVLRSEGGRFEELEGAPNVYLRHVAGVGPDEVFITGWGGTIAQATTSSGAIALEQMSDHRLEGIWGTTLPDETPRFFIVGVTGTVLVGP